MERIYLFISNINLFLIPAFLNLARCSRLGYTVKYSLLPPIYSPSHLISTQLSPFHIKHLSQDMHLMYLYISLQKLEKWLKE